MACPVTVLPISDLDRNPRPVPGKEEDAVTMLAEVVVPLAATAVRCGPSGYDVARAEPDMGLRGWAVGLMVLATLALAVSGWGYLILLAGYLQVPARPVPVQMAIDTLLTSSDGTALGRLSRWATTQAGRVAVWLGAALTLAVVLPQVTEPDGGQLRLSIFMAGSVALAYGAVVVLVLAALWWARIVYGLHPIDLASRGYYTCAGIVVMGCLVQTLAIPAQVWFNWF